MSYRVRTSCTLLEALELMFQGRSRKDLRRLLSQERVLVDGAVLTDPRAPVKEGAAIECVQFGRPKELHPKVRLLFEDEHLLAVEKGSGILTSEGVRGRRPTVVDVLERYLRNRGLRRKVVPCHRLDRDVSGVCLLAKDPGIARRVRDDPRRFLVDRVYHALVEGTPEEPEGTLRSFLEDDDVTMQVREVAPGKGKLCVTHYRVVRGGARWSALEVRLETGRKNQIRVHLASLGHPVAGDLKYGARRHRSGRVALHAVRLTVVHPITGERIALHSPVPESIR
jgi:23S rRNA pseudouridine1911/1915/1917 synthase